MALTNETVKPLAPQRALFCRTNTLSVLDYGNSFISCLHMFYRRFSVGRQAPLTLLINESPETWQRASCSALRTTSWRHLQP